MKSKKLFTIAALIITMSIAIFLYLKTLKYSIKEISDTNITNLSIDKEYNLHNESELSELFVYPGIFFNGKNIKSLENWRIENETCNNYDRCYIFRNIAKEVQYTFEYGSPSLMNLTAISITSGNTDNLVLKSGKDLVNLCLTKLGFTYKESLLKNGVDLLLKEKGNRVLVGFVIKDTSSDILRVTFTIRNRQKNWRNLL